MKRFTVWGLARINVSRQRFQSLILLLLLLITTVTVFFSGYLAKSMQEGLAVTKERLGADLIVVPNRFVSSIENALFVGKPCTVNFDQGWIDKIAAVNGVDKVSSQLYISSLSMDCCDTAMQLIAFDMNSDFAVSPWLSQQGIHKIADDEIILGCNMKKKVGDEVKYYGRKFKVISVLQGTGMGYDNCAFISYGAAYKIANDPKYANILPFQKNQKVISMVLVKLKAGQSLADTKERILKQYGSGDIAVYATSDLLRRFADNLKNFVVYARVFQTLFLLLATVALYGVYRIAIHLRKAEFGTYLSFGTKKQTILCMLLAEILLLAGTATAIGIGLVSLFTIPFHEAIRQAFAIPYLMPHAGEIAKIGLHTLLVNLAVCAVATVQSFYELARMDGIALIKSSGE